MEREGREEEKRRGRRGGEMRKGIIVGGMILGLLMGCNNGIADELAAQKRLGEIGRSAENVFYSFVDFIAGTLGFTVKADTSKSDVGKYFNSLGEKLGKASNELEEVAKKSELEAVKDEPVALTIRAAVDTAKEVLSQLKTHLDALGTVGGDSLKIGEVGVSQAGVASNKEKLEAAYDALKGIVDIAKKEGVKAPEKSSVSVSQTSLGNATVKNGAKVLAAGADAGGNAGPEAAAIVSAVNGKEILAAIIESSRGDATGTISGTANGSTSALKFAIGGSNQGNLAQDSVLAGEVSGGIALRSLVKDGKLASHSTNDNKGVEVAGRSATSKLLGAIEDIIRDTVKNVIEKAKGEIDKARASKATVQK